jgi:DNA-binding transcriptional LysR family regulator
MLSLQQLRVFQAVATEGSVGGAALALGCAQPTVSHHLAALEKTLGTQVLIRHARGITLTDRGRILLSYAERILADAEDAARAVRDRARLAEATLRVATFATAGATFLPWLLARFRASHPAVRLLVTEHNEPSASILRVRRGEVDVAFVFTVPDWAQRVPELRIRHLFHDPLLAALPESHPLARLPEVPLAELAREQWITQNSDNDPHHVILLKACSAAGFAPACTIRSDDYATIATYVASGLGIALVPGLATAHMPAGVRCVPVTRPPLFRDVRVIYPAGDASAAASAFIRIVTREEAALQDRWA